MTTSTDSYVSHTLVSHTTHIQLPLPSTVVDSLPSGWSYSGCFVDYYPPEHVLVLQQPNNATLTVESCVNSCYSRGYTIAGMQNSQQCSCGHALFNGGSLAPRESDCHLPCIGNTQEICGATNRLSVYANRTLVAGQLPSLQPSTSTNTAPTVAPSHTGATSRTPISAGTVAAIMIGVVVGTVIIIALSYCLYRRIKYNRLRTKGPQQVSSSIAQAWPPAPAPSWEEFMKETEEHYAMVDKMISRKGDGSGLSHESTQVGYRPSVLELKERYDQLLRIYQRSFHTGWGPSSADAASATRYSSPRKAPTPLHAGHPMSILKHPVPTGVANMGQGTPDAENSETSRGSRATRKLGLAKKGVRFGVNQIREFGRSPFLGHGSDC